MPKLTSTPTPILTQILTITVKVALKHEEEHKLRQRLAFATPQADQFLRSVWPTDIPWQDEDQLVPLLKANQPFSCPIEGCNHTVTNKTELLRHLRLAHTKLELKRALEGERPDDEPHTQFVGAYVMVPPFRPPVQAPEEWVRTSSAASSTEGKHDRDGHRHGHHRHHKHKHKHHKHKHRDRSRSPR